MATNLPQLDTRVEALEHSLLNTIQKTVSIETQLAVIIQQLGDITGRLSRLESRNLGTEDLPLPLEETRVASKTVYLWTLAGRRYKYQVGVGDVVGITADGAIVTVQRTSRTDVWTGVQYAIFRPEVTV